MTPLPRYEDKMRAIKEKLKLDEKSIGKFMFVIDRRGRSQAKSFD